MKRDPGSFIDEGRDILLRERDGRAHFVSRQLEDTGLVSHGFGARASSIEGRKSPNPTARSANPPYSSPLNRSSLLLAHNLAGAFTMRQVHGDRILALREKPKEATDGEKPIADGVMTDVPDLPLVVFTADCLPILFLDRAKKVAGIVHAGRRGTVLGITGKAVEEMVRGFGSRREDVMAVIGPHIGPCCYRLDGEALEEFQTAFGQHEGVISDGADGAYVDLRLANALQLQASGIAGENILSLRLCTKCNPHHFHSYRRSGAGGGRQMSFIMLKRIGPE